jgi:hypothetical protein
MMAILRIEEFNVYPLSRLMLGQRLDAIHEKLVSVAEALS